MKEARPTTIPGGEEAVVDEEEDETPGLLAEVGEYEGTKALVTVRSCINGEECPRERGKERGGKRERESQREKEPNKDGCSTSHYPGDTHRWDE